MVTSKLVEVDAFFCNKMRINVRALKIKGFAGFATKTGLPPPPETVR